MKIQNFRPLRGQVKLLRIPQISAEIELTKDLCKVISAEIELTKDLCKVLRKSYVSVKLTH